MIVAAVFSWCLSAYMVPVVWAIVWLRRRMDLTPVLQAIDYYWDPAGDPPAEDEADDEL